MKVISISNSKGGVGKTTTATAMASILQAKGYQVLLIDADQQGNSTDTYRADIGTEDEPVATLFDAVLVSGAQRVSLDDCIQHTPIGDIVPSDKQLSLVDSIMAVNKAITTESLKKAIKKMKSEYDFVIIDSAPGNDSMLLMALSAADNIIITTTANRYGTQALSDFNNKVYKYVVEELGEEPEIIGVLITLYRNTTKTNKEVRAEIETICDKMNTQLFEKPIALGADVEKAQMARMDLYRYAKNCPPSRAYYSFVDEYLDRIGAPQFKEEGE